MELVPREMSIKMSPVSEIRQPINTAVVKYGPPDASKHYHIMSKWMYTIGKHKDSGSIDI